jgi:dsRNA-specific ribonuclease
MSRAKIRPQDAVSHLYHFCSSILNTEYVNLHPEFQYETKLAIDNTISVRGKVFLPNAITPELRAFTGSQYWKTKKLARADVAFEAYVKLYEAGLLNANLLYLKPEDDDVFKDYQKIEKRPSLVSIPQQYDPWLEIVERWRNKEPLHETTIHIKISSGELFRMAMVLPQHIPQLPSLDLYPSTTTMATLEFAESSEIRPDDEGRDFRENWTKLLLGSVFATRWPEEEDPVWLTWFSKPVIGTSGMTTAIQEREHALDGYVEMDTTKDYPDLKELNQFSIIRDRTKPTQTYTFHGVERRPVIQDDGSEGPEEPHFKLLKLPKKVDLMRPFPPNQPAESTNYLYVRSAVCDVDGLPWYHCQFARFIPSIMHHVERELVANHLNEQIFASSFKFQSLEHLKTAITTSAAQETENYQRLEFFGDSILKMYTTVHLLAQHMNWHEGYLSHAKDSLVSNRRLAIAAVQSGIAFYIRTQPFPVNKWKPPTIYSVSKSKPPGERDISSKTLADVIEALLGAAFFDGKEESIVHLLNMLLPELRWTPLSQRHQILFDAAHVAAAASGFRLPAYFSILVSTVGYEFRLPYLLLTAVTHPSCLSHDLIPSYQRLEFLGDSMLDFIVTSCIREHASNLTVGGMHLVRTTVVNADFLAFCCMNNTIPVPHVEIVSGMHDLDFASVETNRDMAIWHFMRHNHAYELVKAQKATFARFQRLREDISSALNGGSAHPWTLLAGLDAPKFFSDLIESILGAIYIDSSGSEEKCIQFLEHVGIMPYLKRLLNGGIKVISPKEELNLMTADYRIEYTQDFPKPGKVYCADGAQDGEMEGGRKWTVTVAIYPNSYDQYDCREWTVVGETSKIEAEMRAAEMAIHSLRGLEA